MWETRNIKIKSKLPKIQTPYNQKLAWKCRKLKCAWKIHSTSWSSNLSSKGVRYLILNWDVPWMNVQFLLRTKLNYQIFILTLSFGNGKNKLESGYFILSNFVSAFLSWCLCSLALCNSCGDHLVTLVYSRGWLTGCCMGCGNRGSTEWGLRWDAGSEKIISNVWVESWGISLLTTEIFLICSI